MTKKGTPNACFKAPHFLCKDGKSADRRYNNTFRPPVHRVRAMSP